MLHCLDALYSGVLRGRVPCADDLHSEASSQAGEHALDRLDEMPASPAGANSPQP